MKVNRLTSLAVASLLGQRNPYSRLTVFASRLYQPFLGYRPKSSEAAGSFATFGPFRVWNQSYGLKRILAFLIPLQLPAKLNFIHWEFATF